MRLFAIAFLIIGCAGDTTSSKEATDKAAEKSPETQEVSSETEAATNSDKNPVDSEHHFGAPFTINESQPAHSALSNPSAFTGKTVRLTGTITDVCQKKGCWMVIEDNGLHMRVLMKDHAFAVDMNATGKTCDVEGAIIAKQENPAETEHYASESTPGTVIPEQDKKGDTVYQFHATGVQLAQQL